MKLSRRGFLQVLGVAAGTAALDPISKLWIPEASAKNIELAFHPQAFEMAMAPLDVSAAVRAMADDIDQRCAEYAYEQVHLSELDGLAREVAIAMSWRINGSWRTNGPEVLSVGGVDYKHVSESKRAGYLEVPGIGTKRFIPCDRCVAFTPTTGHANDTVLANHLANELVGKVFPIHVFVPITRQLRPGDDFSDDIEIGVGSDPQTGLSVRVIRFEQEAGRRRQQLFGVEMAGGTWLET